jgi:NAD(P)-dependent dehydrogenase (short-subunit alcohol dehydrogenase family)
MVMVMNLNESVALVTGANRGLGARLVQELLRAGAAKVYATSRTPGAVAADVDGTGRRRAGRTRGSSGPARGRQVIVDDENPGAHDPPSVPQAAVTRTFRWAASQLPPATRLSRVRVQPLA